MHSKWHSYEKNTSSKHALKMIFMYSKWYSYEKNTSSKHVLKMIFLRKNTSSRHALQLQTSKFKQNISLLRHQHRHMKTHPYKDVHYQISHWYRNIRGWRKESVVSITLRQKKRHTKTNAYTHFTLANEDTHEKIDEIAEYWETAICAKVLLG